MNWMQPMKSNQNSIDKIKANLNKQEVARENKRKKKEAWMKE